VTGPRKIIPIREDAARETGPTDDLEFPEMTSEDMDRELARVEIRRADMNRVFEASMELLDQVDDPQELFDAILTEYSRRLDQFPGAPILPRAGHEMTPEQKQQLALLVLFSSQAVLLKDKAKLFSQLRSKHHEVKRSTVLLSEALRDAEEARILLQTTLENLPSGVVVFDRDGRHRFSNGEAESLLAAHPTLFPSAEVCRGLFGGEADAGADGFESETRIQGPSGEIRTIRRKLVRMPAVEDREPLAMLLVEDVTEELLLREEILRNGRLTAVLDTWAALNHEINNPLAAILGRAQILLARPQGLDEKTIAGLRIIEESAIRIVDLAARLKELQTPTVREYRRGETMLDIPGRPGTGKKSA